jgi:DNA recombination protein RmuC
MDLGHAAFLAAGLAFGAALAWLALRGQASALAARLAGQEERRGAAEAKREELEQALRAESSRRAGLEATLAEERKSGAEKLALLDDARAKLSDAFKALSSEVLQSSSRSFLELARTSLEKYQEGAKGDLEKRQQAIAELVAPVRESLQRFDARVGEIEKERAGSYSALREQVAGLAETQKALRSEASNLVKALRAPQVRGRWGEVQLRRVVELAGMVNYCDFTEQETVSGEAGRLRPDVVVRLPGGKSVVVDAKAPLAAYLDAVEAPDEATRQRKLAEHAKQVKDHVLALSRKAYWDQFQPAPEFVVLFLPGESFYSAALEQDPSLIETGADRNVVIATPTTLIALLKAVAYGWKQQKVAENAREISALGRELHKRLSDVGGHLARVGRSLGGAVEAYNAAVGSLESRVLPSARKFKELEAAGVDESIETLQQIDRAPRELQAPELTDERPKPVSVVASVPGSRP